MSTTLAPQPASIAPIPATNAAAKPLKSWLVGPWFDLFFLANLMWPIAVLLAMCWPLDDQNPFSLFQIYFLSTPHRWITLVLVFCDSDRFWKQPAKFGGLALGLITLGLSLVGLACAVPYLAESMGFENALPYATSSLVLLMMLDYIWNAWHFAAQHAGISRIYGRITRPEQSLSHAEFEKMAIRTFVLWVFFRFAIHVASATGYNASLGWLTPWLAWIDPFVFIPVGVFLVREVSAYRPQCIGRLLYIGSVIALYSSQLLAIRLENRPVMIACFFGGAIFHAVEYLAVCNWSVQKKVNGVWHYQITRSGVAVLVFMAVIGIGNWLVAWQSLYVWTLITLLVSLLHYGYDGIIWRARPAPAPK